MAKDLHRGDGRIAEHDVGREVAEDRAKIGQIAGDLVDDDVLEVELNLVQARILHPVWEVLVVIGVAVVEGARDRDKTSAGPLDALLKEAAAVPDDLVAPIDQYPRDRRHWRDVTGNG
jgi:hypothetical protein